MHHGRLINIDGDAGLLKENSSTAFPVGFIEQYWLNSLGFDEGNLIVAFTPTATNANFPFDKRSNNSYPIGSSLIKVRQRSQSCSKRSRNLLYIVFVVFRKKKRKFPVILDALSPFHLFLHSSRQIFTKGGPSTRDEYSSKILADRDGWRHQDERVESEKIMLQLKTHTVAKW